MQFIDDSLKQAENESRRSKIELSKTVYRSSF